MVYAFVLMEKLLNYQSQWNEHKVVIEVTLPWFSLTSKEVFIKSERLPITVNFFGHFRFHVSIVMFGKKVRHWCFKQLNLRTEQVKF